MVCLSKGRSMKRKAISRFLTAAAAVLSLTAACGCTAGALSAGAGLLRQEERDSGIILLSADSGEAEGQAGNRGLTAPAVAQEETVCPETIAVYVCGAVAEAGVCFLDTGARLYEAVEAAGGFLEGADRERINLAAKVTDGCRVYIPDREDGQVPEIVDVCSTGSQNGMVNINTADKAALMTLPGIGESKAEEIIRFRESIGIFTAPEDIMKVPGIKEKAFEKIRVRITI